jgi:hypothetical protein
VVRFVIRLFGHDRMTRLFCTLMTGHPAARAAVDGCEIGSRPKPLPARVTAGEVKFTIHPGPRWPSDTNVAAEW